MTWISPFSSHTGQLLSTTSGAHGEDRSVESRDSGEELSTSAVKRKCVRNEDTCSLPLVPDTPLEKYADFLRACYTKHEHTSTKWPHLDARMYVKLAVINNEYPYGGWTVSNLTCTTFHVQYASCIQTCQYAGTICQHAICMKNYRCVLAVCQHAYTYANLRYAVQHAIMHAQDVCAT